mgnify:CR=1 FL=1
MASNDLDDIIKQPPPRLRSYVRGRLDNPDDADDIREIARYNLQGIPVTPSDKGIQIIVYSNYTTKTVVVE